MERIWIYQADRFIDAEKQLLMAERLQHFASQWQAHGKDLSASAELRYGLFVILKVDDAVTVPSGCSIDESVYFLKNLEKEFEVQLFDRTSVAFRDSQSQEIRLESREGFEKLIEQGQIHPETIVFNNLINTYAELDTKWESQFKDSWHARVFGNVPYSG